MQTSSSCMTPVCLYVIRSLKMLLRATFLLSISLLFLQVNCLHFNHKAGSRPQFIEPTAFIAPKTIKSIGNEENSIQLIKNLENIEIENVPIEGKESSLIQRADYQPTSCQLVQIVHLLQHPGCQSKAIASFACSGSCFSYVQTSTSKLWQHERSCSCCQQIGSQEATFTLDCPSMDPPYKKVKTYAPTDCLCRSCTDLGKEDLRPHELVEALAGDIDMSSTGT